MEGRGPRVPRSRGLKVPGSQGPGYLKLTFKYELDSKEGPSCYRWLLVVQYNFFIVIVPYCYVNIYVFCKNLKIPATDINVVEKRKKRNIVTFSYNMLVWIIEALFAVIVSLSLISFIIFKELI